MLAATLCGILVGGPFWVTVGWLWSKTEFRVIPLTYAERLDGEPDVSYPKRNP